MINLRHQPHCRYLVVNNNLKQFTMREAVIPPVIVSEKNKSTHNCPKCKSELTRINRNMLDRVVDKVSFGFFHFKRFYCSNCGWQGILSKFNVG